MDLEVAECIVPGYIWYAAYDRYGCDLYQAWSVKEALQPGEVRAFCERTVNCSAFNYPWGILKYESDNYPFPGKPRDDLRAEDCTECTSEWMAV